MEARFEVETEHGPVWLWGRDTGRPLLLVLSGAFASADFLERTQIVHPDVDVLRAHLPGNHCPTLTTTTMDTFVAAYDEALARRFSGRPVTVLGASMGGVLGLGLRHAMIRSRVAVEPPILAAGLWPLYPLRRDAPAGSEDFLAHILGIGATQDIPVDHSWVLNGLSPPATVILGGEPLHPPRRTTRLPSLVIPAARAMLANHPSVRLVHAVDAGHNIPRDAPDLMHAALLNALQVVA